MIEEITVKNFKSLADVTFRLSKFNCFVGMNGAGKTSILQVLDFISQQMQGNLSGWFESRGWKTKEIAYRGQGDHPRIGYTVLQVILRLSDGEKIRWTGFFSRTKLQLVTETAVIVDSGSVLLRTAGNVYHIDGENFALNFNYEGSILSQLKNASLPPSLIELRDALAGIRSLELLSPHLLRKRSRAQNKHIGIGGEKLSGFLDGVKGEQKENLTARLRQFYPLFDTYKITTAKGGWKNLQVTERRRGDDQGGDISLDTDANHLNDGFLRILAIIAEANSSGQNILLLDEIENGINPEIIETLVDLLVESPAQIIVTTHSPMILNYLEDDVAINSVKFVYKDDYGRTSVRPLFSVPRMAEKLQYMGPGEAFVDTNLRRLAQDCVELDRQVSDEATAVAE